MARRRRWGRPRKDPGTFKLVEKVDGEWSEYDNRRLSSPSAAMRKLEKAMDREPSARFGVEHCRKITDGRGRRKTRCSVIDYSALDKLVLGER